MISKGCQAYLSSVKIFFVDKFILRSLFVALTALVAIFLLGEITVRYIQYRTKPPSKVRQKDPLVHHSFRPNTQDVARSPEWESHYIINSLGMRDKEYSEKKPEDTFRILMVGDSYMEGQGVEFNETTAKVLEKALSEKVKGKKIEVMNAGVLSYSPLLEYSYLKHKGLKVNPDLVILNFDQGDVIDDHWYEPEAIKDDQGMVVGFRVGQDATASAQTQVKKSFLVSMSDSIKKFFHSHSAFYLMVANSVKVGKLKLYPEIGDTTVKPYDMGSDKLITTREPAPQGYSDLWTLTKRNLKLIRDLLNENKVKLVITDYPYGHQVDATEWNVGRKKLGFEEKLYQEDKNFKTLSAFALDENILYHSMVEDFRKETNHPMYFKDDGHWNQLGHQVAGLSIKKYLLDNKLIPE